MNEGEVRAFLDTLRATFRAIELSDTMKVDAKDVKRRAGRFVERVGAEVSLRDERTGREVSLTGSLPAAELKPLTLAVLAGQGDSGVDVRRYFFGAGARVEDPRTGEGTPRLKDVMRGEIDLFIAGWMTRPPDAERR